MYAVQRPMVLRKKKEGETLLNRKLSLDTRIRDYSKKKIKIKKRQKKKKTKHD